LLRHPKRLRLSMHDFPMEESTDGFSITTGSL
jgi:hypothetical protein